MSRNGKYTCPICEKGTMTIWTERGGPRGNRMTDWFVKDRTCDCEFVESDAILMAIETFKDENEIKNKTCERCGKNESTVHNPVRSWLGEYEDICTDCFKVRVKESIELNKK